jgi:hypothetical protein
MKPKRLNLTSAAIISQIPKWHLGDFERFLNPVSFSSTRATATPCILMRRRAGLVAAKTWTTVWLGLQ